MARFVAYPERETREVEELLTSLNPRSARYLGVRKCRWKLGTRLEPPSSAPPPAELSDLQFADVFSHVPARPESP